MKQKYENSTDTNNSSLQETDPRKRLREKLNKKRLMRQTNQIKKAHMENLEAGGKTNEEPEKVEKVEEVEEIIIDSESNNTTQTVQTTQTEVSKKTLQNRKKAQKKKENKKKIIAE